VAPVNQREATSLTSSERQWLRVRSYLREHRYDLSVAAADLYPELPRVGGTPLLTSSLWVPPRPLPLDRIALRLDVDQRFDGVDGTGPYSANVRPLRADGARYPSYSAAVAALAAPAVFENRGTYRLLDADLAGPEPCLVLGRGSYFDGTNTGEAVGHEYAQQVMGASDGDEFRVHIGSPVDPSRRPTNLAISALTIRLDRSTGDARFLLHWRDPAKVGHAGGLYQVIPVGIFQPATDAPASVDNDLSLWRCLVREYAEEILGEDEPTADSGPVDYDHWPFAVRMSAAVKGGRIAAFCVGMGVDALTLAVDLLTVVVVDSVEFDELFGRIVRGNAEGEIVGSTAEGLPGLPFVRAEVERLVHRERMQAAGAAVLATAWEHRPALLGFSD
jgi:hypothetical protein